MLNNTSTKKLPSSAEEGWLRDPAEKAEHPNPRRRDGDGKELSYSLTNTTPSAPNKVASQFFTDVASTPPRLRRGAFGRTKVNP